MEGADDSIVLIIMEDDDEPKTENQDDEMTTIKQEPPDLVEKMLETAERHGQNVDIKHWPTLVKTEPCDESKSQFNIEAYTINEDEYEKLEEPTSDTKSTKQKRAKFKRLPPSQWFSYVSQLRIENREFSKNGAALVKYLAEVMKSYKPPPPPADFYRVHGTSYECIECGKLTNKEAAAANHYQSVHGPLYLTCFACGTDFRCTLNLYKHERRCRAPDATVVLKARALAVRRRGRGRPFMQPKISKKERNRKYMQKHAAIRHPCTECSAVFRSKKALISHEHLHRGERPYACEYCPSAYTNQSALMRHQELHTGNKYVCDHCERVFKKKTILQDHMETHYEKPRYQCTYGECRRRYTQPSRLREHINKKHKMLPPPCPCQVCPKRFNRMTELRVHMKKKHGLILMTRKMFFKSLPQMSETQVQQAKLIFNDNKDNATIIPEELMDTQQNQTDYILPDTECEADQEASDKNSDFQTIYIDFQADEEEQEVTIGSDVQISKYGNVAHTYNVAGQVNNDNVAHTRVEKVKNINVAHTRAEQVKNINVAYTRAEQVKNINLAHTRAGQVKNINVAHTRAGQVKNINVAHTQDAQVKNENAAHTRAGQVKNENVAHTRAGQVKNENVAHTRAVQVKNENLVHTRAGQVKNFNVVHTRAGQVKNINVARTRAEQVKNENVAHTQAGQVKNENVVHTRAGQVKNENVVHTRAGQVKNINVVHTPAGQLKNINVRRTRPEQVKNINVANTRARQVKNENVVHTRAGQVKNINVGRTRAAQVKNENVAYTRSGQVNYVVKKAKVKNDYKKLNAGSGFRERKVDMKCNISMPEL